MAWPASLETALTGLGLAVFHSEPVKALSGFDYFTGCPDLCPSLPVKAPHLTQSPCGARISCARRIARRASSCSRAKQRPQSKP